MNNKDIRNAIVSNGLKYWQVAASLNITDSNFSKKLRLELPKEEKTEIFAAIDRAKKDFLRGD